MASHEKPGYATMCVKTAAPVTPASWPAPGPSPGTGSGRSSTTGGAETGKGVDGRDKPYRMHRSQQRPGAAVAHPVMARLVRAIYSSTCAATDGPDKADHDGA